MQLTAQAILIAARPHGETASIARLFTRESGVVAAYVAGGRGRQLRPVLIPGNMIAAEIRSKSDTQLPFARLELVESRGPWLTEPLAAAAIGWICALSAATLPERQAYPALHDALAGTLTAICHAGAAREWLRGLIAYEKLLLRELGFGGGPPPAQADLGALLEIFAAQGPLLERYLLAERGRDVMAARARLGAALQRMMA